MVEEMDLPHNGNLLTLESFVSSVAPTRLRVPQNTSRIDWVKYSTLIANVDVGIAEDTNSIGTYDFGGSFPFATTPNGSASSGGVATFSLPVHVLFETTFNFGDATHITIVGTNGIGAPYEETIDVGPNEEATFTTSGTFLTVTDITGTADGSNAYYTFIVGNSSASPVQLKQYYDLIYKEPKCFVDLINARATADANVIGVRYADNAQIVLPILTNSTPHYWTAFDDEYIWFDSWDSSVESTINVSKTEVFGYTSPGFSLLDDFIPDLPANLFPYLFATVKTQAFADFKQGINQKAEQRENRLRIRAQRNKWRQGRKKGKYENDYARDSRSSQSNRIRF
jgi:hypothetical protein